MNNLTAFCEGMDAAFYDGERGSISDNPYTPGTLAFRDWYRGYNREGNDSFQSVLKEQSDLALQSLAIASEAQKRDIVPPGEQNASTGV